MIDNKAYAYDFSVPEYVPNNIPNREDFKVIRGAKKNVNKAINKKLQTKAKTKLSLVFSLLGIFSMCILMSLRYNIISEKNLELQRLKTEQTKIASELSKTEVELGKTIDKDKVEAYAKQQLGMQKPEKNQMIYINTDSDVSVNKVADQNIFEKGLNKLKIIIGIE